MLTGEGIAIVELGFFAADGGIFELVDGMRRWIEVPQSVRDELELDAGRSERGPGRESREGEGN